MSSRSDCRGDLITFKRGDKVKAARDVALGLDVVIRAGCPGRVGQRIGALSHTYVDCGAWYFAWQRGQCGLTAHAYYAAVRQFGGQYFNNPYKN